jgi:hypothetical protein
MSIQKRTNAARQSFIIVFEVCPPFCLGLSLETGVHSLSLGLAHGKGSESYSLQKDERKIRK